MFDETLNRLTIVNWLDFFKTRLLEYMRKHKTTLTSGRSVFGKEVSTTCESIMRNWLEEAEYCASIPMSVAESSKTEDDMVFDKNFENRMIFSITKLMDYREELLIEVLKNPPYRMNSKPTEVYEDALTMILDSKNV